MGAGGERGGAGEGFGEASATRLRRARRRRNVVLAVVMGLVAAVGGYVVSALLATERSDAVPRVRSAGQQLEEGAGLLMVGDDYELHVRDGQVRIVPMSRHPPDRFPAVQEEAVVGGVGPRVGSSSQLGHGSPPGAHRFRRFSSRTARSAARAESAM